MILAAVCIWGISLFFLVSPPEPLKNRETGEPAVSCSAAAWSGTGGRNLELWDENLGYSDNPNSVHSYCEVKRGERIAWAVIAIFPASLIGATGVALLIRQRTS